MDTTDRDGDRGFPDYSDDEIRAMLREDEERRARKYDAALGVQR